jgi:carboxyl-terminal processing protease
MDTLWLALKDKLPEKMVVFVELFFAKLSTLLPSMKLAVLSFLAGTVLTFGTLLFLPAASNLEALTEPVTLFETILTDLDRAYVDQVDTQKLFETGVSAMLRSLDPYTEFEGKQEAADLTESIDGRYGGVGLVISGATPKDMALLTTTTAADEDDSSSDAVNDEQLKFVKQVQEKGIRVVSAFEGYAFDAGMRVGDKLVAVDGMPIGPATTVDQVRNRLRGEPGTYVDVSFEREGVDDVQTVSVPRTVVRIRDVKLATMLGNAKEGIGYIQLTGFSSDAGREVRNAILALQQAAEDATNSESSLKGLVLDLRGNPGGLLTSAVDVVSCLVPKGSDIVSARGRGFPGVLYRSRSEPVLDSRTKLVVLVNGGTASAAEIVSGAVQDLDVGIIVGADRTFGKGLVQNVQDLPFNTALKFTVAKYYTPSGRCIQGIQYTEGGGLNAADGGKYQANKVADKDKTTFYTKRGREVQDGGGIEADYKVSAPKASALEVTLLRSGIVNDFAAQWSRTHALTSHFEVDEDTYKDFQAYVQQKQKDGDIKLEALYNGPINDLRRILEQSGYKGSTKDLEQLQASIVRDLMKDFDKYRVDIKEDLATGILARYLPESMLIERSIRTDTQVQAALKLVRNDNQFAKLLAKGSDTESSRIEGSSTVDVALAAEDKGKLKVMKW